MCPKGRVQYMHGPIGLLESLILDSKFCLYQSCNLTDGRSMDDSFTTASAPQRRAPGAGFATLMTADDR